MGLEIRPVKNRSDLKKFITLPERIHVNHSTWVPPLYLHEWQYFDPRKNSTFDYCDTLLLLACEGNEAVGRIMGIVNHRYNELRNERTARFGYLETYERPQIVHSLLACVEDWARQQGMNRIVGPYGFSDQDPEGFLVEGFEHRATIGTNCNFEWMVKFVESEGYAKELDYVTYRIDVPKEIPPKLLRFYDRTLERGDLRLVEFQNKRSARPWARRVFDLMNECYSQAGIYGYAPLDDKEMDSLLKRYMPLLDPRFLKVVAKGETVVAFIIGIPDGTSGIQRAGGRLLPFGFLKILRAMKETKQLDVVLGAIKGQYRRVGLDTLLYVRIAVSAKDAGISVVDTHHVMETNRKMRMEYERLGGELYKRFRVYQKSL